MYPSVRRGIPDFVADHLVFSDSFTDLYKRKTCLVLTRNLKFLEFYQKELMCCIDLSETCLRKVKTEIETCKGPKGNMFESLAENGSDIYSAASSVDTTSISATTSTETSNALNISFGKYVSQSLKTMKIYFIIRCWDKMVILHRLPEFKGFKIKAEYEDLQWFRITHGLIKFCPILEICLKDTAIKTDLEETECEPMNVHEYEQLDVKQLLEKARSGKNELELHKIITGQSFKRLESGLTFGVPSVRSHRLDEKQFLSRCGDIWMRITSQNELVIGIPLVNQCGSQNITIIQNIRVQIQPTPRPENCIKLVQRLFQLKQSFDQMESIQTFLLTEDAQIQKEIFDEDRDCRLLPESYAILIVKFKMSQIMNLKQCPLLLSYDISKEHNSKTTKTTLQTFLKVIDFHEIMYEQHSKYEISFRNDSLHIDMLAIAMSSQYVRLKIVFESSEEIDIFENCLINKFQLSKLETTGEISLGINTIFFCRQNCSIWFGCLVLRYKESEINEGCHPETSWKIYCPVEEKLALFMKFLITDLIVLKCNVMKISNTAKELCKRAGVAELENALRLELSSLKHLLDERKSDITFNIDRQLYINFYKNQMKTDEIMTALQIK